MKRFMTIGMAGHIDHGKTTLTKALTGIETDRLKEEKERNISIELGYAPLIQEENLEVAIVDVPGHERFIRQMIAGVAGIDMVLLVIAADEGVMPQTQGHIDILSLLGMENGIIVLTKTDTVDEELRALVVDDIEQVVAGTFLENSPLHFVDSVSGTGIDRLVTAIKAYVTDLPIKDTHYPFRLPIDDVFTIKGQGVVVRGTIYDGDVVEGERLYVLPKKQEVRVRQIQSHQENVSRAVVGQRTAINLGGTTHTEIKRGDVLVRDETIAVTSRIDVAFDALTDVVHDVKQRTRIKLHIGTSEVMGKMIFFDRNELFEEEALNVLCQLELDEPIVTTRGDRFIVRRASPVETIGGGEVIEPAATKYRFGQATIDYLREKQAGSVFDRIALALQEKNVLTDKAIMQQLALSEAEWEAEKAQFIEIAPNRYTSEAIYEQVKHRQTVILQQYHDENPLQLGMDKATLISQIDKQFVPELVEYLVAKEMNVFNQYVALPDFVPSYPRSWEKRLIAMEADWKKQGAEVEKWKELGEKHGIPSDIQTDVYHFMIRTKRGYPFDEGRIIAVEAVEDLRRVLESATSDAPFTLQIARDVLQLSRKNLVPLLEVFDDLGYTKRDGNERNWQG